MTIADQFRKEGLQQGIEQGIEQGVKEGMQRGMQRGIQQGMQKGAFEEKRQVALGMLQEKLPLSVIKKITGLSEKEIKSLTTHS